MVVTKMDEGQTELRGCGAAASLMAALARRCTLHRAGSQERFKELLP